MEIRKHETDWAQKYRPTRLEDMILPPALKRSLMSMRNNQEGPSLLLHGVAGTGKTTAAMLINPDNTIKINCSTWTHASQVAGFIDASNRCPLPDMGKRVVIMDESDYLSERMQAALRGAMEDLSHSNCFVFTANYPDKIIGPLQSRLHNVDFGVLSGNQALRTAMQERVMLIIEAEGIEADVATVRGIVNRCYPDMRQVLAYFAPS